MSKTKRLKIIPELTERINTLEIRNNMAEVIRERFPEVKVTAGDIQKRTEFEDKSFDRIIAVHVLEHLSDLPSELTEISRLLKDDGVSYMRLMRKTEHVNTAREILHALSNFPPPYSNLTQTIKYINLLVFSCAIFGYFSESMHRINDNEIRS